MAIKYIKKASKTPETDDHKTQAAVQTILNDIKERKELKTITGRNKILQIRTSGSKKSDGTYTPLKYNGHQLKDKYMRFYITGKYAKKEIS